MQTLYVTDLPGEHVMKLEGDAVAKGTKTALEPGKRLDLSGAGGVLLYEVVRDEHAHA